MKVSHLFVVMALAAVLSLVGCGGGGGGGSDVVAIPVDANQVVLAQNVTVPAADVAVPNLKAKAHWTTFTLQIQGATFTYAIAPTSYEESGTNLILKFRHTFQVAELGTYWDKTNQVITAAKLLMGGQVIAELSNLYANGKAATADTTPTAYPKDMVVSYDATTGAFTVTFPNGGGTATGKTIPSNSFLFVEKIMYSNSPTTLATMTYDTRNVTAPVATFTLFFNAPIANATTNWTILVKNVNTGAEFTLTSANDASLFDVSLAANEQELTIVVRGNETKSLRAGTTYQVTLQSSDLSLKSNNAVKLSNVVRQFTTASAQ